VESEFWHGRWESQQIGFHQARVNPWLERHWQVLDAEPGARVFVPLCGKSLDMRYLESLGHQVVGVELSPIAVRSYFVEASVTFALEEGGPLARYAGGRATLYCGDYFALTSAELAGVSAVFDRAALIALPPEMRKRYVAHSFQILPRGTRILLVTLVYEQALVEGPPFCVTDSEVARLYAKAASIELVGEKEVRDLPPKFANIEGIVERAYRIDLPR